MLTRVALLRAGAGAYARTAPYGHARLGPRPPLAKRRIRVLWPRWPGQPVVRE